MIKTDPRAHLKPGDVINAPGRATLNAKHTQVIRLRLARVPLPISFRNEWWEVHGYPVDELERTVDTRPRRAVLNAALVRGNPLWLGKLDDPRASSQLVMRSAFVLGDYVTLRCEPRAHGGPYKVYWNRDLRLMDTYQRRAEALYRKLIGVE